MSIVSALAEAAPALPTPPPTSDLPLPTWITGVLLAWLALAVIAIALLGFFRRRSIVGPKRLAPGESAASLMLVLLTGAFISLAISSALAKRLAIRGFTGILLINTAAEVLAIALILLMIRFTRTASVARLGMGARQLLRGVPIGIGLGLIIYPIVAAASSGTMVVLTWLHHAPPPPHQVLESLSETHNKWVVALDVIAAVIVAPLVEELVFRGVLQTSLARCFRWFMALRNNSLADPPRARWLAVLITAACFAAVHGVPAFVPPLFVLAVGLGYVYERTGNLWAAITIHSLFNAIEIVIYLSPLNR